MDYRLKQGEDDWVSELALHDDPTPNSGFTKEAPEDEDLFGERDHILNRSSSAHRPSLFDIQISAVALAADVVWEELRPALGMTMVRFLQLERVEAQTYAPHDLSEIEAGTIHFRAEVEATYPQYRRRAISIPVEIKDGRPRRGLHFVDSAGRRRVLTQAGMEKFMNVKDYWFTLSREPDVLLALTDRVECTDFPNTGRPAFTSDIGLV